MKPWYLIAAAFSPVFPPLLLLIACDMARRAADRAERAYPPGLNDPMPFVYEAAVQRELARR